METATVPQSGLRRRDLLFAAMIGPASARASSLAVPGPAPMPSDVLGVVTDDRFPQARAFADHAASNGLRSFRFSGEMSSVWFDQLFPALQATPLPLLGLTNIGALFCFEQLAWLVGLRVHLRIDHHDDSPGAHHVASATLSSSMRSQLAAAGPAFGGPALDVALACRSDWHDCTHAPIRKSSAPAADALVTWVIAPLGTAMNTRSSL